jgi:hypothetical protein
MSEEDPPWKIALGPGIASLFDPLRQMREAADKTQKLGVREFTISTNTARLMRDLFEGYVLYTPEMEGVGWYLMYERYHPQPIPKHPYPMLGVGNTPTWSPNGPMWALPHDADVEVCKREHWVTRQESVFPGGTFVWVISPGGRNAYMYAIAKHIEGS